MNEKMFYRTFDPKTGYPAGADLFYECQKCGGSISSQPAKSMACKCRNITIDVEAGRISVQDQAHVKLFSVKNDITSIKDLARLYVLMGEFMEQGHSFEETYEYAI